MIRAQSKRSTAADNATDAVGAIDGFVAIFIFAVGLVGLDIDAWAVPTKGAGVLAVLAHAISAV